MSTGDDIRAAEKALAAATLEDEAADFKRPHLRAAVLRECARLRALQSPLPSTDDLCGIVKAGRYSHLRPREMEEAGVYWLRWLAERQEVERKMFASFELLAFASELEGRPPDPAAEQASELERTGHD